MTRLTQKAAGVGRRPRSIELIIGIVMLLSFVVPSLWLISISFWLRLYLDVRNFTRNLEIEKILVWPWRGQPPVKQGRVQWNAFKYNKLSRAKILRIMSKFYPIPPTLSTDNRIDLFEEFNANLHATAYTFLPFRLSNYQKKGLDRVNNNWT